MSKPSPLDDPATCAVEPLAVEADVDGEGWPHYFDIVDARGGKIATLPVGVSTNPAEVRTLARAMAAAPKMLELLGHLDTFFSMLIMRPNNMTRDFLEKIRAITSKIEPE